MRAFSDNKEPDTLSDHADHADPVQVAPGAQLTHDQCINELSKRLKSNGMKDEELEIQVGYLSDTAKLLNSTDPFSVIKAQIETEFFKDFTQETKDQFLSVKKALTPDDPEYKKQDVNVNPADAVLNEKDAQAASVAKNANDPEKDHQAQLEQALQQQKESQRNMVPVTFGGALAAGIGSLVKKAFDRKEGGPGKSFANLQASGDGLGMNNPNMDPHLLAESALQRLENAANGLAKLKAGSSPELVEKAKSGVLEAAEDAQLYMGNKHRSDMTDVATGKKTEFSAKYDIGQGSDRFQKSLNTAKNADVAFLDKEFQEAIKTNAEKAKEMVKQLMDSLKEIAGKLFGAGADNDNDNKKTAAPKPAGPR